MIWTTTPWTIPGNRAIAFSPAISLRPLQVADAPKGRWRGAGEKLLLADALAEQVAKHAKMMLDACRTVDPRGHELLPASPPQPGL